MKTRLLKKLMIIALALFGFAAQAFTQSDRNSTQYNLQNGIGLKGYDPVSYFPEGGNQPIRGQIQFRLDHGGVTYYFGSEENFETFRKNPEKYEPTYGGWCAYAMASGSKVDIQPTLFTIHGNRAHFFVSSRAKQSFDRDITGHESRADGHWKQISGEEPRL